MLVRINLYSGINGAQIHPAIYEILPGQEECFRAARALVDDLKGVAT